VKFIFKRYLYLAVIIIAFKSGFASIRPACQVLYSDSLKNDKIINHFISFGILGDSYISGINYTLMFYKPKRIKFGLNMGYGLNIFNLFIKTKEFDSDLPKDVNLINGDVIINHKIGKTIYLKSMILIGTNKNFIDIKNGINYIDGMFYNGSYYDDGLVFFNTHTNQLLANFPKRNYLKSLYISSSFGYKRINKLIFYGFGFLGLYHFYEFKINEFDSFTRIKNGNVYYPYKKLIANNKIKILPYFNIGIRF
jgi:hypothetical protein